MLDDNKHYDPEDMNSMVKPYKMQCEMAKFASNYGPFGSHGMYPSMTSSSFQMTGNQNELTLL